MHFGYRGCFEDLQKDYAEDHKCTVMATTVGLGHNDCFGGNKGRLHENHHVDLKLYGLRTIKVL